MADTSSRHQQAEALRERICAEAVRLFGQLGFAGTSIQAVADAVGISKQALMHHFPSKQRLREAAFDHMQASVVDMLPRLLVALTTGEDRLDIVLDEIIGFLDQDPHWAKFIVRDLLDAERDGPDFGPSATAWVAVAVDYIRRGQAEGTMRADIDPEASIASVGLLMVSTIATMENPVSPHLPTISRAADWRQRRLREVVRIVRTSMLPPRS